MGLPGWSEDSLQDVVCRRAREDPDPVRLGRDRYGDRVAHREPDPRRRRAPPRSRARERAREPSPTRSTSRNRDPPRGQHGERASRARDHGGRVGPPGCAGVVAARRAPSRDGPRPGTGPRSRSDRGRRGGRPKTARDNARTSQAGDRARPRPHRLLALELISGEAASVDASSRDMEGQELHLLAFVLSARDSHVVAAAGVLTKFPALDLPAADYTDRSGRSHSASGTPSLFASKNFRRACARQPARVRLPRPVSGS